MPEDHDNQFYVSNVSNSDGSVVDGANNNAQEYGSDISQINKYYEDNFITENITHFNSTGAGIFSGKFPDGTTGFFTSRTIAKTIDLVSEGLIEGIVSGEWIPDPPSDKEDVAGQIGWNRVKFEPYVDGVQPEAFLRSVYLNDTPIVNRYGQYNFQNVECAISNGTPSGIGPNDNFLFVGENNKLEKTRVINERLRGPDKGGTNENPFAYHPKVYRVLNPEADKLKVNIKIASLSYTKQGDEWPMEEWGQTVGTSITINFRYRPIYKDKNGILDLSVSRDWVNPDQPITTTIQGLVTSAYIHPVEIELDDDLRNEYLAGYEVEVIRTTMDSIEANVSNQSFVDTITTVFADTLAYPNSAIVSMNFNAEYFSQIPTRSYDMRLLKVKVPTGYDPKSRTYAEAHWDGTFQSKKQWTDNPAWIFYDLLTNKRYGVGKYLDTVNIDIWTLYEVSKFCDVLVPNGEEGLEPRFTCNTLINTREDAYKVLQDFASVFRAILYYGLGSIHTSIDKPRNPVTQFTNVNVEDGDFRYTSSSANVTHTVCVVRYNDKDNFYKPAIEYVENAEGIRKHGIKEKEITAFACTSRSQAIRLGRWLLATEAAETELIQFNTGPEASLLRPGDLIKVNDTNRSDEKYAGRLVQIEENKVILDRDVRSSLGSSSNYQLTVNTPAQYYDTSLVNIDSQSHFSGIRPTHIQNFDFSPSTETITLSSTEIRDSELIGGAISGTVITNSSSDPMFVTHSGHQLLEGATWSISNISTSQNLFSITSIKEEEPSLYSVEGMVHNPSKYDYIESGVLYSFVPSPQGVTEPPPHPLFVALGERPFPGSSNSKRVRIKIAKPDNIGTTIGYQVYIKEGSNFTSSDTRSNTSIPKATFLYATTYLDDLLPADGHPEVFYFPPRNNKRYYVRVFAINSVGGMSSSHQDGRMYDGSVGYPISNHYPIRDVQVHSLRLYTEFNPFGPASSATKSYFNEITSTDATVTWEASFFGQTINSSASSIQFPITYRINIHEANTGSSTPLATITNYSTDTNVFTYSFEANSQTSGGPRRHYDLTVEALNEDGDSSSANTAGEQFKNTTGWDIIEIHNPRPKGYCLTPRRLAGTRPGDPEACDLIHTEQFIDKDGLIDFKFLLNSFTDLAGGYMYLSKHPFSGADFKADGTPLTVQERPNIALNDAEIRDRIGEYQIIEAPFSGNSTILPGEFSVSPPAVAGSTDTFLYSDTYYMSVKFFDSFDRAIGEQGGSIDKSKLWMGFARDNVDTHGNVTKLKHRFSADSYHDAIGDYENGTARCCSSSQPGTYAVPLTPTRFASSQAGGFRWWIRLNVNGQWEGQGISHVKTMTAKDVQTLYDYKGYYEYGCENTEVYASDVIGGMNFSRWMPFHDDSHTRCRFKMAKIDFSANPDTPQATTTNTPNLAYAVPPSHSFVLNMFKVTGSTNPPNGLRSSDVPLPRAGIAYGGWGEDIAVFNYNLDKINSYNERDQLIAGKDRPLRGFRRFRVYFDPNNLPPRPSENQLSSYSVVGMNSWNGPYETYPGSDDLGESILGAKDITFAGTNPAGTSYSFGIFTESVKSYMREGDLFENIPGVWNHHPAGFGQGFGGLVKTEKYFDVHLGRMIDDSYLNEGFFGIVTANDYSIVEQTALHYDASQFTLHESVYQASPFITLSTPQGGDGESKYP